MTARIEFKLTHPGAVLPKRSTPGSGAFDLYAPTNGVVFPGDRVRVNTGVKHRVNVGTHIMGHEFRLHGLMISRSGMASKKSVRLFWEGLIDNDYRGDITIHLENRGTEPFEWEAGDRICQIGYIPFFMGEAIQVDELDETERGEGGHGSTGA